MNHFLESKLFRLLSETSQEATNQEIQCAYGNFIEHINTFSQGSELTGIIRKLNFTRAELVFLSTQIQHEQGKKRAKICLFAKNFILS